jgi:hypothetical protein
VIIFTFLNLGPALNGLRKWIFTSSLFLCFNMTGEVIQGCGLEFDWDNLFMKKNDTHFIKKKE